jgi:mRNA interferase YafQ
MAKLKGVIEQLIQAQKLAPRHKDGALKGNQKECGECHIEPDRLLSYRIDGSKLCVIRTGSHSDLYD